MLDAGQGRVARPVRVFRVDTPQEVATASIAAAALPPGFDVLAMYAGGSYAPYERSLAAMRAMARAHSWAATVDLTDLPLNEVGIACSTMRDRLRRTRTLVAVVREMRKRLADVLGSDVSRVGERLDEVYVSALNAGSMVPTYALSEFAVVCCYPHTFVSVDGMEGYQLGHTAPPLGKVLDWMKRVVWGSEAVPQRALSIDTAISFWRRADWANRTLVLSHVVTADTMRSLFRSLPGEAQRYFEDLGRECGPATGLLLPPPADSFLASEQHAIEMEAYIRLVDSLVRHEDIDCLVLKPHPRMAPQRIAEVERALSDRFPTLRLVVPMEYSALPVEVVVVPFTIRACASILSTCLVTLPLSFPIRSYYAAAAADSLYDASHVAPKVAAWSNRLASPLIAV